MDELEKQLLWALDNIMPWDPFWLQVPDEYVLKITGIEPGKCTIGKDIVVNKPVKRNMKKAKREHRNWAWNPNGERRCKTGFGIR